MCLLDKRHGSPESCCFLVAHWRLSFGACLTLPLPFAFTSHALPEKFSLNSVFGKSTMTMTFSVTIHSLTYFLIKL